MGGEGCPDGACGVGSRPGNCGAAPFAGVKGKVAPIGARQAGCPPARNHARTMAWVGSLGFGSGNQFVLDIGFHGHEAAVHGVDR